jgi:hypothetical protein
MSSSSSPESPLFLFLSAFLLLSPKFTLIVIEHPVKEKKLIYIKSVLKSFLSVEPIVNLVG